MKKKDLFIFEKYHPIVILIYLLGGIGISMLTMHPLVLLESFLIMLFYGSLWIGSRFWKRILGLAIPILLYSIVLMPLFSHRGTTPLFYMNNMPVTKETFVYGMVLSLLLLSVFAWFQILLVLCNQEKILYIFGKILPTFGLLLAMILRLIPLMLQRFQEIHDAQKGLGQDEQNKSVFGKCRQYTKELSVLVSWSLEESMERAISMESRGYGIGKRTHFSLFRWEWRDIVMMIFLLVLYGITFWQIGCSAYHTSYFPAIRITALSLAGKIGFISFGVASITPMLLEKISNRKYKDGDRL